MTKTFVIPFLHKYKGKLPDVDGECNVVTCQPVDMNWEHAKQYVAANLTKPVEGIYQRTIFHKGKSNSDMLGTLFINLKTGEYLVNIPDSTKAPTGINLSIGFKLVDKPHKE